MQITYLSSIVTELYNFFLYIYACVLWKIHLKNVWEPEMCILVCV